MNIRKINIKELNLRKNKIDQKGVIYLEAFLQKVNGLLKLDVSQNKIKVKIMLFFFVVTLGIRMLIINDEETV